MGGAAATMGASFKLMMPPGEPGAALGGERTCTKSVLVNFRALRAATSQEVPAGLCEAVCVLGVGKGWD